MERSIRCLSLIFFLIFLGCQQKISRNPASVFGRPGVVFSPENFASYLSTSNSALDKTMGVLKDFPCESKGFDLDTCVKFLEDRSSGMQDLRVFHFNFPKDNSSSSLFSDNDLPTTISIFPLRVTPVGEGLFEVVFKDGGTGSSMMGNSLIAINGSEIVYYNRNCEPLPLTSIGTETLRMDNLPNSFAGPDHNKHLVAKSMKDWARKADREPKGICTDLAQRLLDDKVEPSTSNLPIRITN